MEPIRLNFPVEGGDLIGAGEASSKMKLALKKLDLPPEVIRRCSICMYEGEINMVIHADGGRAEVEIHMDHITIRMVDSGPGIPNVEQAMEPLYTTGGEDRSGLGFSVMQSFTDRLQVRSKPGKGTAVTMEKYIALRVKARP